MAPEPPMTAEERALLDALPIPESGNLVNALYTLKKAEVELSGKTPPEIAAIQARFATIQTRGDAEAYAREILLKVRIAHEQLRLAELISSDIP